jgi:hypothetical protein
MGGRLRSACAGAAAAKLWAALELLDMRLFRSDFSDVAMLGKLVTRTRLWPVAGVAIHAGNGALFGLAFYEVRRRTKLPPLPLAVGMALAENTTLYALAPLVDRYHPARGERGVAQMFNARTFAQETARHVVFAVALARLAGLRPEDGAPRAREEAGLDEQRHHV